MNKLKPYLVKVGRVIMVVVRRTLVTLVIAGCSSIVFAFDENREVVATELDYALRDALFERDLDKFEQYLSEGADPTVWFENSSYGWVYCAATEPGLEDFLQLIIDKGFDVNFRQTDIHPTSSLPLTCAVRFNNLQALEMLVSVGANPAVYMCVDCERRMPLSVLAEATMVSKYDLAIWLLDKGNYSDAQIQTVITGIEMFPVDELNPRNALRLELAERIRELGFEVNPWVKDKRKK